MPHNQIAQIPVILYTLAVYEDCKTPSFWHPLEGKAAEAGNPYEIYTT